MFQNILKSFPNEDYHIVFDRKILRSLKKAKYHIKNSGHFALSIPIYTHFTSPIRRLCDLIIHHQLKIFLKKKSPIFDKSALSKFAKQATEKELLADEGEKEIDIKYKLIFMKEKLGEEFEALITNITPTGIVVELIDFPISGIIPKNSLPNDQYSFFQNSMFLVGERTGKKFKLTDRLKVLVVKVDNDVIFKYVDDINL